MSVPPTLRVNAFDVVTHVEELRPGLHRYLGRIFGTGNVRLAGVTEFQLRALAAIRAFDQQHDLSRLLIRAQCATAAAAASSMRWPSRKRSIVKGALIGCGSSRAMVCANTCAEPGVALNPPVPQPQFT